MSAAVSFEVLSSKAGKWTIESVLEDKQDALSEARSLLAGRHHLAIKVIEERYDPETDRTTSRIIFNEKKGEKKKKPALQEPKKTALQEPKKTKPRQPTKAKPRKQASFTKNAIILVTVLGGLLLGLIVLIFVYIEFVGN